MPRTEAPTRSLGMRFLSLFANVRPGEAITAVLLALDVFVLLTACYLVKPVREGMILVLPNGAELKSYATGLVAILLVFAVPAYGRVSRRFARDRLVLLVTLFFAVDLVVFFAVEQIPGSEAWLGPVFVLWVGVFNMMVVAQFWAFANDVYDTDQGERLFPLVGIGAAVGAMAGSHIAAELLERIELPWLMLIAAALLVVSAALTPLIHRRERRPGHREEMTTPPGRTSNGLVMVMRRPYLIAMAAFAMVFTFVNTNGEYVLSVLVKDAAEQAEAAGRLGGMNVGEYIGNLYGRFYFWMNGLALVLQSFVVSRLIGKGGLRLALLIVPVLALVTWSASAALPVLAVVWLGKTAENAGIYSITNTARHALWLPLASDVKYNAKQAVDSFFVRLGDVASAGLVFFGTVLVSLPLRSFAIVNVALVVVWLVLAIRLARSHRRLVEERNGRVA